MSKPIDAEAILQTLAAIRQAIPYELRTAPKEKKTTVPYDLQEFELTTIAEAVESLKNELSEALERARANGLAKALEVYYATEKLAQDPANAHLIPHLEAMRRAYEHDYGVPIPPRKS